MLSFVAIEGWKLHKSSDDARRQLEMEKLEVRTRRRLKAASCLGQCVGLLNILAMRPRTRMRQ